MMITPDFDGEAPCRDEDPELFFPVGNSGPALEQAAEAKAVCAQCRFTTECRDWAMETGADFGVFGGMTADERREHPRQHRRLQQHTEEVAA